MKRSSFITWEQLKVGAVILAALTVLTVAIYKLGQAANLFARRYELLVLVPNASGLRDGGAVFVAGQLAGTIKAIEFLPVTSDTMRHLRIRMALDHDLEPQIRGDSKAKVRTLGLLGDKVIDISIGTPKSLPLKEGDMVGLTHDLRQITGGLINGRGTIGQLMTNRALYDQLIGTLGRANTMLAGFENPNGSFGRMLRDPTLYEKFVGVIQSADSLVVALNDKNGTLGRLLRDDTLYTHMVSMAAAGDSLMKTLSGGQGLAGRLLNDPELYDKLNKLTTDLSAIIDDVRKDPRKFTKGMICVFRC